MYRPKDNLKPGTTGLGPDALPVIKGIPRSKYHIRDYKGT